MGSQVRHSGDPLRQYLDNCAPQHAPAIMESVSQFIFSMASKWIIHNGHQRYWYSQKVKVTLHLKI